MTGFRQYALFANSDMSNREGRERDRERKKATEEETESAPHTTVSGVTLSISK